MRLTRLPAAPGRPGYVLVAVLIVVVVLSLAAYQFAELMTAEYRAAARTGDVAQARYSAISGLHYTAAMLADPNSLSGQLANNPYASGAIPEQVVRASDNPRLESRFSPVAVVETSPGVYTQQYGSVTDESGKLNINALIQIDPTGNTLYAALMMLPNMTAQAADSIVDWVDGDETARTNGAESSYYSALGQPYYAKNAPLNSLDELLLVQGVTPQLLYGSDRNRNGVADDDPSGGQTSDTLRGWADYLTVYGRELNLDSTGVLRTNVNDSEDMNGLYSKLSANLPQNLADYIMAYKMFSVSSTQSSSASGSATSTSGSSGTSTTGSGSGTASTTGGGSGSGGTSGSGGSSTQQGGAGDVSTAVQAALQAGTATSQRRLVTLLDMLNTQVTLPKAANAASDAPTLVVPCPLNDPSQINQLLPVLLDKATATTAVEMPPRLNINTAPQNVLMAFTSITALSTSGSSSGGGSGGSSSTGSSSTGSASGSSTSGASTTTTTGSSATTGASSGSTGSTDSTSTVTLGNGILSTTDVTNIVAQRANLNPTDPATMTGAWLVSSGVITSAQFKQLQPFITGRTMVYRIQTIGYYAQGGPVGRAEAVVDTNQGAPRFLYFRDMTGLDTPRGFPPPSGQQSQ